MKIKVFSLILCFLVATSVSGSAEEKPITVLVNGVALETPVAPELINDRTMLPMRAIFEALGARVSWSESDRLIFVTHKNTLMVMQIGTNAMSVQKTSENVNRSVTLDAAPYLHPEGHTMVPARAIAEELDATVFWDGETRTVTITQNQKE